MNLLNGNKVLVYDNDKKSQLIEKGFGEKKKNYLVLSLIEALFLMEERKFEIQNNKGKKVSLKELMKLASKEKNFLNKYTVYKDLRVRGFVIKTGFKFGFDFRVYPRGKKPGQAHTEFVVNVKGQETTASWPEFSRMIRMAGTLKTKFLQAIVDSENDVNYYKISRIVP